MILFGFIVASAGVFLFLWYRTVAGLPLKIQPRIIRIPAFKWGAPVISLLLAVAGIGLVAGRSKAGAVAVAALLICLSLMIVRFDPYTAEMNNIYRQYREIRDANPGWEEAEVLFCTATWRYPGWNHDRLVELVAGKNIESLILLMIINEKQINPLRDWELYRTLKAGAARVARTGN
jgi:hypothetical protein